MDSALIEFRREELVLLTNRYSTDQVLGNTQFGKVYRGKLESGNSTSPSADEIIIKVWRWPQLYTDYFWSGEWESARLVMKTEILAHEEIRSHPSVAKLIGYCDKDGHDALIYNLRPLDNVQNLIPKENFRWLHRVKAIIHVAFFIEYLHAHNPQYLLRNLDARHLILDEGYNLKILDFSMFLGGTFQDTMKAPDDPGRALNGSFDYSKGLGPWSDIFAFGILVLALISKRAYDPEEEGIPYELFLDVWAKLQHEERPGRARKNLRYSKYSKLFLVHKSLISGKGYSRRDGFALTRLAMECVEDSVPSRPSINEVVNFLLKLKIVRRYGSDLGIDRLLCLRKEHA